MFILLLAIVQACEYLHGDHFYNLSALHKPDGYYVRVSADSSFFKMAYQFNFCNGHPQKCQNTPAAYESLEVLGITTDSCEMIGKPDDQTIKSVENGIEITYGSGSLCEGNNKRSVTYKIQCSAQPDQNFKLDYQDKCQSVFSIKSPAGCKQENSKLWLVASLGVGSLVLIIGIVIIVTKMKNKKQQQAKLEAHLDEPLNQEEAPIVVS